MIVSAAGLFLTTSPRGFAQHREEVLDIVRVRISLEAMAMEMQVISVYGPVGRIVFLSVVSKLTLI